MAAYDYDKLSQKYNGFLEPVAEIIVNGKNIEKSSAELVISDVRVELTGGYEASEAVFAIYNCFNREKGSFTADEFLDYIALGSAVSLKAGYGNSTEEVFKGFISRVDFIYRQKNEIPHIEVICMDIKGVMMTGSHECQLTADNYGDAVKELFRKSVYSRVKGKGIYTELQIDNTPDKGQSGEDKKEITMEMMGESDYEFTVRAAKRFNYDFFTDCGKIIFRKAKAKSSTLMSFDTERGIIELDIQYDIIGMVETIQVRGTDYGRAELISAKTKLDNNISGETKAKQLIQGSEKIYIDASIRSDKDAEYRLNAVKEAVTGHFGRLKCKCTGLPELKPGHFIEIEGMGKPPSNKFYITQIRHIIDDNGFTTEIEGSADSIG